MFDGQEREALTDAQRQALEEITRQPRQPGTFMRHSLIEDGLARIEHRDGHPIWALTDRGREVLSDV